MSLIPSRYGKDLVSANIIVSRDDFACTVRISRWEFSCQKIIASVKRGSKLILKAKSISSKPSSVNQTVVILVICGVVVVFFFCLGLMGYFIVKRKMMNAKVSSCEPTTSIVMTQV